MRTSAAVSVLAEIAVHAERLELRRKAVLPEPLIELRAAATVIASRPHLGPVVIDVVDCQEEGFQLTTTGTPPAISRKDLLSELRVQAAGFVGFFPSKGDPLFRGHGGEFIVSPLNHFDAVRIALSRAVIPRVLGATLPIERRSLDLVSVRAWLAAPCAARPRSIELLTAAFADNDSRKGLQFFTVSASIINTPCPSTWKAMEFVLLVRLAVNTASLTSNQGFARCCHARIIANARLGFHRIHIVFRRALLREGAIR